MKRLTLFLAVVFTVYLGSAQTGTVINDLVSNPTIRKSFINALTGPSTTTAGASTAGVLPVGTSSGLGAFSGAIQFDTLVIPGYKPATTIFGISSYSVTPGNTDSTVITYSPCTSTSTTDTVIFARSRALPPAKKFAWWVIQW